MDYKTPGVFVEEVALFPPSVAAVATAIPAFVGHTAQAPALNQPVRIQSLLEYRELFGDGYVPASYVVNLDPGAAFSIVGVAPVNNRRYYLYDCLRHFFDNGGGPCYIVSVGDYTVQPAYGTDTTGLRGGLKSLEKVDEPTILVVPDAMSLRLGNGDTDFVQVGNLHKDMIAQCAALQDRFAMLDLAEGFQAPNHASAPVQQFRNEVGTENLKYAAAYYPWLYGTYLQEIHFQQLAFFDNAVVPVAIPPATIDGIQPAFTGLVTALRSRLSEEQNVFSKISAVALNRTNFRPLSDHFITLRDAVTDPAVTTAVAARAAFSALMDFVRQLALSLRDLSDDAGTSTDLQAQLSRLEADTALRAQLTGLIAFEKNAGVRNSIAAARTEANVETDYATLDSEDWIGGVTVASIAADGTDFTNVNTNSVAQTARAAASSALLRTAFDRIAEAFGAVAEGAIFQTDQAEGLLFAGHPFFSALYERIRRDMSLLPPSGGVAGVYAFTDRSRGVWKAPANVSLRAVIGPAVKLNDQDQSSLNVSDTGKSINAIRAFAGKGTLVWGARTLAGNDNEWRYVNVRRFFIMVEESVKKASEPFVFEPNDANTWIRVRAMIENFLTLQWRQGALAGATPPEAFYVKVGLGETMTELDIWEGRMIVEIGMAAVRPAEFIILRFSHKMQES